MRRVEAQGDLRPMAGNRQEAMEDLRRILAARQAFYGKADSVVRHQRQAAGEWLRPAPDRRRARRSSEAAQIALQ